VVVAGIIWRTSVHKWNPVISPEGAGKMTLALAGFQISAYLETRRSDHNEKNRSESFLPLNAAARQNGRDGHALTTLTILPDHPA